MNACYRHRLLPLASCLLSTSSITANRRDGILPRFSSLAYCVLIVWFATTALSYGINGGSWAYQGFVEDIKQQVKPSERVYMEDASGLMALLSGRTFVSGDGLVNTNEYLHSYLMPGRVADYLRDKHIEYFLTSNIQCYPYRKVMPWTRVAPEIWEDGQYKVIVDTRYSSWLPIVPSAVSFPASSLVFDKCSNGIRELLFRVPQ